MKRCDWCLENELYIDYHDQEWGVPVHDDQVHFEFLVLESMQSGLSWLTILKKRESFKEAFDQFDPKIVSQYDDHKKEELMQNAGIVRNKLKIQAAVNNAKMFLKLQEEFGSFDRYIWSFVGDKPILNHYEQIADIPAKTALSDKVSMDLKKRGFKFLGSITIYSYLQATGLINDHITTCFKR